MSESLEDMLERHGYALESTGGNCSAFTRMNGTAEEIITKIDDPAAPDALMDDCLLTIKGYGPEQAFMLSAFDIVANLECTDGNYPQGHPSYGGQAIPRK